MSSNDFDKKAKSILEDVKDETDSFDKKEIEDGKFMAILSYIGILVLIPYFVEKNNKFVAYHAKQGLNLFLIEVIAGFAVGFVGFFFGLILLFLLGLIEAAFSLACLALTIIGIVNVCNGKARELPVVNKFKIIK